MRIHKVTPPRLNDGLGGVFVVVVCILYVVGMQYNCGGRGVLTCQRNWTRPSEQWSRVMLFIMAALKIISKRLTAMMRVDPTLV